MVDLTAIKPFTYANRRLLPDDDFVARTAGDARALIALGKARARAARAARAADNAKAEVTLGKAAAKPKRHKKVKAAS